MQWSKHLTNLNLCLSSGFVYRNCTVDGWSEMYPPYEEACAFSDYEPETEVYTHAVVIVPIS